MSSLLIESRSRGPIIGVVAPSIQFFSQGIKLAQVHASHTQGYSACNSTTWFLSGKLFSLVHFCPALNSHIPAADLGLAHPAGFELQTQGFPFVFVLTHCHCATEIGLYGMLLLLFRTLIAECKFIHPHREYSDLSTTLTI